MSTKSFGFQGPLVCFWWVGLLLCTWVTLASLACTPSPGAEPVSEPASVGEVSQPDGGREPATPDQAPHTPDKTQSPPESSEVTQDAGPETLPEAPAPSAYKVSVTKGYGSGMYRPGETVHIWAKQDATKQHLRSWKGDIDVFALQSDALEWHTSFTMPARDLAFTAEIAPLELTLTEAKIQGLNTLKKVLYSIPPSPKGLVWVFHGTGGSAEMIRRLEATYICKKLVQAGFGVIATDAEEVDVGSVDDKIRWNVQVNQPDKNVDFQNLALLTAALEKKGLISQQTPLYAFGMSNGGAMSLSYGAHSARVKAAVSYCASGTIAAAQSTKTPTMWLMCANDTNEQVSIDKARENHNKLKARGIDTLFYSHPASPLYEGRFLREGLDLATSQKLIAEFRTNKLLDDKDYFKLSLDGIIKEIQSKSRLFPVLTSLSKSDQKGVSNQIRIMTADHNFYDDYASRTLSFFQQYNSP